MLESVIYDYALVKATVNYLSVITFFVYLVLFLIIVLTHYCYFVQYYCLSLKVTRDKVRNALSKRFSKCRMNVWVIKSCVQYLNRKIEIYIYIEGSK